MVKGDEVFVQITVEKLKEMFHKVRFKKNSYYKSYPEFLAYFSNLSEINYHNLIIGTHMAYGWMPTILKLNTVEIDQVLTCLNKVRSGLFLNYSELELLKCCINNSIIGTSKLLHFINPHNYAIWDSRVYKSLTNSTSIYKVNNTELYLKYLNYLKVITTMVNFDLLHKDVQTVFGYPISKYRAIEVILFEYALSTQLNDK